MAIEIRNLTKIGRLTVLDAAYITDDWGSTMALVSCECGTTKPVLVSNLRNGRTKSCGLCTKRGGTRPRPYKSRRQTQPVPTSRVIDSGKAARA